MTSMKYHSIDRQSRYEVWNGVKVVKEPSSLPHEEVVGRLHILLQSHVEQGRLGRVFLSNSGVHTKGDDRDFVMPDLSYVSNERLHLLKTNGIFGPPDLVVEVVSPGVRNTRRDIDDKFKLYETSGVREYWIIDYMEREIFMYALTEDRYQPIEQSVVLPDLTISEEALFQDLDFYGY